MDDENDETPEPWRPLGVRDDPKRSAEYDTLVEGIPEWINAALRSWVINMVGKSTENLWALERLLREKITVQAKLDVSGHVRTYWNTHNDDALLRLVDATIHRRYERLEQAIEDENHTRQESERKYLSTVIDIFDEAGSAWKVGGSTYLGLVRRVNETAQRQVDAVIATQTDAARKIATAWHNCYKMKPDHDIAYRDAVLAVEAVAIPAITPNDTSGTLGKVIGHLNANVADWTVAALDASQKASGETLLAMLQTLWHNQQRHANSDGTITGVGSDEAEAAVGLAVTLVQWFSAGHVRMK